MEPVRKSIDQIVGTSSVAVRGRTAFALALFAVALALPRHASLLDATAWALGLALLPRLKDAERVFGTRVVAWAILLTALTVAIVWASIFTAFALMADDRSFGSVGFFLTIKAVTVTLAAFGWFALLWIVRRAREESHRLR